MGESLTTVPFSTSTGQLSCFLFSNGVFDILEGDYLLNLQEYNNILIKKGIKADLCIVELFVFGQSFEEFDKFTDSDLVQKLMLSSNYEVLKLFFSKNFYDVTDVTSFINFTKNKYFHKILELIILGKTDILKLFFSQNFCNINNKSELEKFLKRDYFYIIKSIIISGNVPVLLLFGENKIFSSLADLQLLSHHEYIDFFENIILYGKDNILNLFFGENGIIRSLEDIKRLNLECNLEFLEDIIIDGNFEILHSLLWESKIIKSIDDFIKILKNIDEIYLERLFIAHSNSIDIIKSLLSIL